MNLSPLTYAVIALIAFAVLAFMLLRRHYSHERSYGRRVRRENVEHDARMTKLDEERSGSSD